MIDLAPSTLDAQLAALPQTIESLRAAASLSSAHDRVDVLAAVLRTTDALMSLTVELLDRGGIHALTSMPADLLLTMEGRRTSAEANSIIKIAGQLTHLPCLAASLRTGVVSWSQVRSIAAIMRPLPADQRADFDTFISILAMVLRHADPDLLVERAERQVARLRTDLTRVREDRTIENEFLAVQPKLGGGCSIYAEAGPETAAILLTAIDAYADQPHHPDQPDVPSRATQRMEALTRICETALNGGVSDRRPHARLLATIDLAALDGPLGAHAGEILAPLRGARSPITRLTADTLLCDALITPIITRNGQPIAVGRAYKRFRNAVRDAIIARDKGCRFPGCHMPSAWSDAHHITPGHGGASVDHGILLCRQCHRRIHHGWTIQWLEGGTLEFRRRGRKFISPPP